MQWPTEKRTDNAMADRKKDRQCNGRQKKGQTMQWLTEKRTDNAMADRKKDRQCNGRQKKEQTMIYKTMHRRLKIELYE